MAEAKRGPMIGDAASLWNFTTAPGWSREEAAVLKIALQKFGIGNWKGIVESGCLPGKMIQQLSTQTQRMLGCQSTKVYTGMHLDVDRIRAHNAANTTALRKNGLIINEGGIPSREETLKKREEIQKEYGLSKAELEKVALEYADAREAVEQYGGCKSKETLAPRKNAGGVVKKERKEKLSIMARKRAVASIVKQLAEKDPLEVDIEGLSRPSKLVLLRVLHRELSSLVSEGAQAATEQAKECLDPNVGDPEPEAPPQPVAKPAASKGKAAKRTREAAASAPAKRSRGAGGQGRGGQRAAAAYVEEDHDEDDDAGAGSGHVDQLVQMGFSKKKAQDALLECGGSLESAVEWLFMNT